MPFTVHIGSHRTGSSAIQAFCARNRHQLARRGIIYPSSPFDDDALAGRTTPGNAHHLFQHVTGEREHPDEWKAHLERLDAAETAHFLYSAEVYWGSGKRILRRVMQEIQPRIIVYLRRQTDYLVSAYALAVRRRDFDGTIEDYYEERRPEMHYFWKLDRLERLYGPLNVRAYHRDAFEGGTLISDFLAQIGVTLDDRFTGTDQRVNRHEPPDELPDDIRRQIIAEYSEENAEIERRWFGGENWLELP